MLKTFYLDSTSSASSFLHILPYFPFAFFYNFLLAPWLFLLFNLFKASSLFLNTLFFLRCIV